MKKTLADIYQNILKETIPQFKEISVRCFIRDGLAWYDDPRNMMAQKISKHDYIQNTS